MASLNSLPFQAILMTQVAISLLAGRSACSDAGRAVMMLGVCQCGSAVIMGGFLGGLGGGCPWNLFVRFSDHRPRILTHILGS